MQRFALWRCLPLLILLLGIHSTTHAQLLGNDFHGVIYDVNTHTGAATHPRATGLANLVGVTYRTDGTLFGLTALNVSGQQANSLYRIDPTTGAATLIGTTSLCIAEGDLDFDPLTGVLYGIQDLTQTDPQTLFTIDTTTGAGKVIGSVDASADLSALAFDANADLFALDTKNDRLLQINKTNAHIITSVPLSRNLGSTAGMDFDPVTGTLYVTDGGAEGTKTLYTLDTTTGNLTSVGQTQSQNGLAGLAFTPLAVPESDSAILSMTLLLGSAILLYLRYCGRKVEAQRLRRVLPGTLGVFLSLFTLTRPAHAAVFTFEWEGAIGFSAQGNFAYHDDPTLTTFTEQGLGTTRVLDSLTISFFDPDRTLFATYAPVIDGESVYEFLDFSFDTQNQEFIDAFNVGKDDSVEGDTYLISSNSNLMALGQNDAAGLGQLIDFSFNGIAVQAVPEPGKMTLLFGCTVGTVGFLKWRRNSEHH